jgi:hypothetical protein
MMPRDPATVYGLFIIKGGISVTLSLGKIASESIVFIIENQFLNDSDPSMAEIVWFYDPHGLKNTGR